MIPFNIDHAQKAGEFARTVFEKREQMPATITERVIIANDTKMFAQADTVPAITHFVTADRKCETVFKLLAESHTPDFEIIPLQQPYNEVFGLLDL